MKNRKALLLISSAFRVLLMYTSTKKELKRHKPLAIFFANDHVIATRTMLVAARELDIKTIYIQHACVTDVFPPLGFSVALLDGQDAEDKYTKLGNSDCKIVKVGILKYDKYKSKLSNRPAITRIGICVNMLDTEEEVLNIIRFIKVEFPDFKISIRMHPRYNLKNSKIKNLEDVNYSNNDENAFDFFSRQDLHIAGTSSVHLEAVLMNVISLRFSALDKLANYPPDYYGFERNHLILTAHTLDELSIVINKYKYNKPLDWYKRGKYYVENISLESNALDATLQSINGIGIH